MENLFNIKRSSHVLNLWSDRLLSKVRVGMGVDCSDPFSPILSVRHPFYDEKASRLFDDAATVVTRDDIVQSNFSYFDSLDAHSLANMLRANLQGSYRFASASAAYSQSSSMLSAGKVIVSLIETKATGNDLPETKLEWNAPDQKILAEIINTDGQENGLDAFVSEFGSHYISSLQLGSKIAISGEFTSQDAGEKEAFSAAFKASFGVSISGGFQLSKEQRDLLQRTTIKAEIVCGNIKPNLPVIMTNYEEVVGFLKKLADGTVTVTRGPTRAIAKTYWPQLRKFPVLYDLFGPARTVKSSENVMPQGTVIAWYPSPERIITEDGGAIRLDVPDGWAIADGLGHPLDLRTHFVRGAENYSTVQKTGGGSEHRHGGRTIPNDKEAWRAAGPGPQQFDPAQSSRAIETDSQSNLPPFTNLIYLIKL